MKQDITVIRSRTRVLKVYVNDSQGNPYVLGSGETLILGVKKNISDTNYVIKKTATMENCINGAYVFNISPSDTSGLLAPHTYQYDVCLVNGEDCFTVIETSRFDLAPNVSEKE